ncbi:MAG: DUF255 domain-containing protein [Chitinophagaceae bacterium]|nr:DUF255 domain-containing protein [Chitinophagaceae bacterium]
MKKPILIAIFLTFFSLRAFNQVKFENISFEQALQKAKESGKLIFLQFESPDCDQCNEVADRGLEDPKIGNRLEQGFISIKITGNDPDRKRIANFYGKEKFFGSVFLGTDGNLIHTFPKTTTFSEDYIKQIDIALYKAGEGLGVSQLEKEYRSGNKSIGILEQLLILRKTLIIQTDSLLDEYVSLLPDDSLRSPTTLVFIARQYPLIGSNADKILRKNFDLFNKSWYSLSLGERVNINNRIIYKSIQKAIREKDTDYAYRVAAFARATNNNNPKAGNKSYDSNILDYYKGVRDTLNYLARAINFYDSYYMTVNVDSVKQKDTLNIKALLAKQVPERYQKGDSVVLKKSFSYSSMTQPYAKALNEGAWNFYEKTNDLLYLKKALQWSYRALEFFESPEIMDTQARLLYKTGQKEEAIQWESKAIDLKKQHGFKATEFEKVLEKMKNGKQIIDN